MADDLKEKQRVARDSKTALAYQTGFGNHFATEAKAGEAGIGGGCLGRRRRRLHWTAAGR